MPTVLRSGPYHFYFYSHEPNEPPHIQVDRDDLSASSGSAPSNWQVTSDSATTGFRAHELREIQSMVGDSRQQFLEAWNEFFGVVGT